MLSDLVSLKRWWQGLDSVWKDIFITNLDLEGMFALSDIEYVLTLETLDCSHYPIDDLEPIRILTHLKSLEMGDTEIEDLSPLLDLCHLEELHATFCCLNEIGLLRGLPNLKVLDLSYPRIPIADLHHIGELSSLRQLYLNGCQLSFVSSFLSFPDLEVLSLFFNPIHNEGKQILRQTYSDTVVLI